MVRNDKKSRLLRVFLPLLLLVVVVLSAIGWYRRSNPTNETNIIQITPEPVFEDIDPEENMEEPSPSPEESGEPSSSIEPNDETKDEKEASKDNLTIQVLNGSGVSGEAGKFKTILEDLGYSDIEASNADNFDYEDTIIRYKADYLDDANDIKAKLGAYTVVLEEVEDSYDFDLEIVIGVAN